MKRSPKDTEESARKITRRGLLMGGTQLAFVGVLGLRMRYLQVEQADQFRLLAEENRINLRLLPPARGLIFDRNGAPLAANEQNYRIVMVREDAGDVEDVLERLSKLVPLADEDRERALREMNRRSPFVPVTVADRLSWDDVSKVAVNAPALPGVTTGVGLSRMYPMGPDLAHVVGYVGPVSDYDLDKLDDPDPLLQIPKFQIGKTGVEAKLEMQLRGKAGSRRIEVNATGRVMRELDRDAGEPGNDLQLSIDAALQNFALARLGAESASAVVIDTQTGDLLAAASSPSFDPNKFVRGISVADYTSLTENKYRPLAGKAVQGTYPPGSTFKMITALAAMEAGVATPDDTVYCPGHTTVGGRRFHCWKRGGHGWVNLFESIQKSCDVYYYDLSQRVGIEKITEMARRLGLGQRHDIPMSAVAEGLTPTKAWKRANRQEGWQIGDTLNSAIGQGFVLASPLQLAVMCARLATGRAISPRLIKSIDGVETPVIGGEPLGLNENLLRQVRQAMYAVSNHRRGTAYRSRIVEDAFRLAGKTGTSQVRNTIVRNQDVPWEQRDHALFVGFAPFDNPRFAASVVVEHGGGGSTAAAPVARDLLLFALYNGYPPLEAYPSSERAKAEEMQRTLELRDPMNPTEVSDRA
ncbi:penicillin-binding protein 2 [Aliiroseovarius sp. YM-037]|uniref:penicillin-binding protein 2 n=1 Tax=Aliiroseovarius sp. YM-037 TaxID=3341728 RepID=UPI003A805ED7